MILGFYYHSSYIEEKSDISMPSYLGVFINSILNDVDELIIFGHLSNNNNLDKCDYKLKNEKIKFVNIGYKTSSLHRFIFNKKLLKQIKNEVYNCDAILVRGPSPLAPFFYKHFRKTTKIFYLIVGDYSKTYSAYSSISFKQRFIKYFDNIQDSYLTKSISDSTTFVNSETLYNKYRNITKNLIKIRTTTISKNDIIIRDDSFQKNQKWINILYSGRFDINKGLFEILEASKILIQENYKIRVHFVGWEDSSKHSVKKNLIRRIDSLSLKEYVFIHGKKKVGPELFKFYKDCQLFLIPSYFESFPRTIWEAFANSLPVIASEVGSIPYYTSDKENILLIKPRDVISLKNAMVELIENQILRKKLIINGRKCVEDITLEIQSKLLMKNLHKHLD